MKNAKPLFWTLSMGSFFCGVITIVMFKRLIEWPVLLAFFSLLSSYAAWFARGVLVADYKIEEFAIQPRLRGVLHFFSIILVAFTLSLEDVLVLGAASFLAAAFASAALTYLFITQGAKKVLQKGI